MNNYVSVVVALFEHLELLTKEEAKKLAGELHTATLPDTYENCSKAIGEICQRLELKKAKSLTTKL